MFDGKVAVITGGARGIGLATAELLTAGGARVVIADVDGEAAERSAGKLGNVAVVFAGDLREPDAPDRLVNTAVDAFGRVDVVVNNAGYTLDGPLHRLSDAAFEEMIDVHVIVPFRLLRAAAPHLRDPAKREREEGREIFRKVVNVTSVAGTMGNAGQANYSSGKAALVGLTKTLAKEWGRFKINVNAVAFGLVDTRLTLADAENPRITVEARRKLEALIPLGRSGTVLEAAGAIAFLCSPWSDYVTGQVLSVSGGMAMGMTA